MAASAAFGKRHDRRSYFSADLRIVLFGFTDVSMPHRFFLRFMVFFPFLFSARDIIFTQRMEKAYINARNWS